MLAKVTRLEKLGGFRLRVAFNDAALKLEAQRQRTGISDRRVLAEKFAVIFALQRQQPPAEIEGVSRGRAEPDDVRIVGAESGAGAAVGRQLLHDVADQPDIDIRQRLYRPQSRSAKRRPTNIASPRFRY